MFFFKIVNKYTTEVITRIDCGASVNQSIDALNIYVHKNSVNNLIDSPSQFTDISAQLSPDIALLTNYTTCPSKVTKVWYEYPINYTISTAVLLTPVVALSVHDDNGDEIEVAGLNNPNVITFTLNSLPKNNTVFCAFWNITSSNWSTDGCSTSVIPKNKKITVVCKCYHLTDFSVLLGNTAPTSDTNETIIIATVVAVCACIIIAIIIIVVYFVYIRKRQRDKRKSRQEVYRKHNQNFSSNSGVDTLY